MTIEGMEFCLIPAGPFLRTDAENTEADLPYAYWLARYLVTNAQFQVFVDDRGYQQARFWPEAQAAGYWQSQGFKGQFDHEFRTGPYTYPEPFTLPNHPVVGISWYEAVAFCHWLTAQLALADWEVRLPTQPEWEKGARGGLMLPSVNPPVAFGKLAVLPPSALQPNPNPRRIFPWGDPADPERANCTESKIGTTSAAGCFASGASPYGLEELSGNVWEWSQNVDKDGWSYLRGNAYYSVADEVAAVAVNGNPPDDWYYVFGFRCVVVPLSRV